MNDPQSGKLFVVGTPIGNLEDMTFRAVRTLKEVDFIAAEDTRHTLNLLKHFEINRPLISYHQFNEAKRTAEFSHLFMEGKKIALVSDAGMPGISDPGERLIRYCIQNEIAIEIIPGPSAVLHALVGSGFAAVPFYFGGFLPVKSGGRQRELTAAFERKATSLYFESPYRIVRALEDAVAILPERSCCVARELTKKFEEFRRGKPAELLAHYQKQKPRGEFCLLIAGKE